MGSQKGFLPDKVSLFELTEDNCKNYLSDVEYFKMHPLNNHFAFWINDKITLKYMLQQPLKIQTSEEEKLINLMPEYYLYIENDGHYSYLMDAPERIFKNKDFLLNLLKEKRVLALKPSRGEGGRGFVKLEYIDGIIIGNGKLKYAIGMDLITAQVRAAVGDDCELSAINNQSPIAIYNEHWAEIILHADKSGIFDGLEISHKLQADVVEKDLWVQQGDVVNAFNGANNAIGTLVLRFNDENQMNYAVTHQSEWLKIRVK